MRLFGGKKGRKSPESMSFTERFDILAYEIFGELSSKIVRVFEYDKILREAGLYIYPDTYMSRVLLISVIAGAPGLILLLVGLLLPTLPLMIRVAVVVSGILTPVMTFVFSFSYPWIVISSRRENIKHELPYIAAYLTTMARGGISPIRSLEKLARTRLFPAFREEAMRILKDIRLFGMDPLSAIEFNARSHPNSNFRDFMLGYVSTVRTGGDVIHYLETKTHALFEARSVELRQAAERMETYVDIFISSTVILGISFYVFFMVASLFPAGGYGGVTQLLVFLYLAMPFIAILLTWMIHLSQPRAPITLRTPYKVAAMFIPAAIGIFALLTLLDQSYLAFVLGAPIESDVVLLSRDVSIALIVPCIFGALSYSSIMRAQRGFSDAVADFLRDITEIRKTGMSPERSIIYAANRSYGGFSKVVKRIAAHLSWGLPLSKAVEDIVKGLKDWIVIVNLNFLADAVSVGGGSVLTLDTLALFASKINLLNKELKSKLKPYVLMPYVGSMISTASTLLVLNFMIGTIRSGTLLNVTINPWYISLIFVLGLVINAWFMGMATGKIAETYIAAGFKHAIIIVLTTYAIIWGIFTFIIG